VKRATLERGAIAFLLGYAVYLVFFGSPSATGRFDLGPAKMNEARPEPPYRAPELSLPMDGGPSVSLAELRGRPVVLSFWAPWCAACRRELDGLERLAEDLGGEAAVLAVATMYGQELDKVRDLAKRNGLARARLLLDGDDEAARRFAVAVLPTTLIVDAEGVVRYRVDGVRHWEDDDALADLRRIASLPQDAAGPQTP